VPGFVVVPGCVGVPGEMPNCPWIQVWDKVDGILEASAILNTWVHIHSCILLLHSNKVWQQYIAIY
jgi:hypothetical protein